MLEQHQTREGHKLLVAEMTDSHLQNLVKMNMVKLGQLQSQMSDSPNMSEYQARMYGVRTVDVEEAARQSRKIIKFLYPYLAELYLRGLTDLIEPLRKVIGRDGQLTVAGREVLLPASTNEMTGDVNIDQLLSSFQLDESLFPIQKGE